MTRPKIFIPAMLLPIVVFLTIPATAEMMVDTAWVRTYNGPGDGGDYATSIAVSDSGYVCVTGDSDGEGTNRDYATIKYHPNGDTVWVRRYNGPGNGHDFAFAIAVDRSGNVLVTGKSYGGPSEGDFATIKYYPNGDTAWVRRYSSIWLIDPDDGATAMALDSSGNVYVTGYSANVMLDRDYTTIKYDSSGNELWVRSYAGVAVYSRDVALAVAVDGYGNVYVTGDSNGDYATIKYSVDGDTAWVRRYNGPGNNWDTAYAIAIDNSGNVYVTGQGGTVKYDIDGNLLWTGAWGGFDLVLDSYNNACVTGGTRDYVTVKYYPAGDTAWVRWYNGQGDHGWDAAHAMASDSWGNIYVTGASEGSGTSDDYATIKYDSSGNELWIERYNRSENSDDVALAVSVDDSGNVYVTGRTWGSGTAWWDYATIKYVQTGSGVKDETENRERPCKSTLSQNYPNPFNQATKIEFTLARSGFVSLSIYDILGRKVRTLVSDQLASGYKSVLWDGRNDSGKDAASGVYFYQLRVRDFSQTRKLVLLK